MPVFCAGAAAGFVGFFFFFFPVEGFVSLPDPPAFIAFFGVAFAAFGAAAALAGFPLLPRFFCALDPLAAAAALGVGFELFFGVFFFALCCCCFGFGFDFGFTAAVAPAGDGCFAFFVELFGCFADAVAAAADPPVPLAGASLPPAFFRPRFFCGVVFFTLLPLPPAPAMRSTVFGFGFGFGFGVFGAAGAALPDSAAAAPVFVGEPPRGFRTRFGKLGLDMLRQSYQYNSRSPTLIYF